MRCLPKRSNRCEARFGLIAMIAGNWPFIKVRLVSRPELACNQDASRAAPARRPLSTGWLRPSGLGTLITSMRKQYHFRAGPDSKRGPSFPVILSNDGRVMDRMHRIAKALFQGYTHLDVVRFASDPEPDYVGVHPDALPY